MPDRPKRPLTAFFLWLCKHRPQIKAQNPGLSVTQIAKKAGEMWRTVDKREWIEKAERLKAQYVQEMAAYNARQGDADCVCGSRNKRRRTRARSLSSYSSYSDDSY